MALEPYRANQEAEELTMRWLIVLLLLSGTTLAKPTAWSLLGEAVLGDDTGTVVLKGAKQPLRRARPIKAQRPQIQRTLDQLGVTRSGPKSICLRLEGPAESGAGELILSTTTKGIHRLADVLGAPSGALKGHRVLNATLGDLALVFDAAGLGLALFHRLAGLEGAVDLWLDPPASSQEVELQLQTTSGARIRLPARIGGAKVNPKAAWRIRGLAGAITLNLKHLAQQQLLRNVAGGRVMRLQGLSTSMIYPTWHSEWHAVHRRQAVLTDERGQWQHTTAPYWTRMRASLARSDQARCALQVTLKVETDTIAEAEDGLTAHLFDPKKQRAVVGFVNPPCAKVVP